MTGRLVVAAWELQRPAHCITFPLWPWQPPWYAR